MRVGEVDRVLRGDPNRLAQAVDVSTECITTDVTSSEDEPPRCVGRRFTFLIGRIGPSSMAEL